MKRNIGIAFTSLLLCLSTIANADTTLINRTENAALFNSDIYSLSKKKEDSFDAPSATYIISSDDVRRSGATSIPEVLRLVPGVQVARNDNNSWSISVRGFNAQYSNKLLVMIDGRTIYTTLFSGVFWDAQDYPLEDIERIEVVKGPGGTIWGANAVNGVVNIITKSASLTQGGYVSGLVGNKDRIAEQRFGGKIGMNDFYRVYAKETYRGPETKVSTDTSNNDNFHGTHAGFRYDVKSIPGNDIFVASDVSDVKSQNYFETLNPYNNLQNNRRSRNANLIANWNRTLSKKSNFTMQSYLDYTDFDLTIFEMQTRVADIDFQHFYNFSDRNQFIWGLGYRRIDDSIEYSPLTYSNPPGVIPLYYTPQSLNYNTYSTFIQDKIGIVKDKLYLTIGSKFEHNDYTKYEYQPNIKLTYYPSDNQTAWASVSRAVRTPTRGEESLTLSNPANGVPVQQGSRSYDSEDMIAYEVGYRIKPIKTVLFDFAAFFNDYTNLRTFESATPSSVPTADNLGYGTSHGFEVNTKWQATRDWRLEVGYSFLKMDIHIKSYSTDGNAGSGISLWYVNGQAPKNQLTFKSSYNITPKIQFDNILYYVDSLPNARNSVKDSTVGAIPAYIRFDTRIAYSPLKNLELSLVGQNLTDSEHEEFKAALFNNQTEIGRTFYFKVVLGF